MSVTIALTRDAEKVMRSINKLGPSIRMAVMQGIGRQLLITEGAVRKNSELKSRRGSAGLFGRLTSYSVPMGGDSIDAAIGFRKTRGFPYELSQEFGAKASAGKAMAIPISPQAKALSDRGQGPRSHPAPLQLVKKLGKAMLIQPTGGDRFTLEYVLVKSIRPRLHFMRSVGAEMPAISEAITTSADKAVKEAARGSKG